MVDAQFQNHFLFDVQPLLVVACCGWFVDVLWHSACCRTHLLTTYSWFLKTHLASMGLIWTSFLECHSLQGNISFMLFKSKWVSSFLTAHQHIIGHFSAISSQRINQLAVMLSLCESCSVYVWLSCLIAVGGRSLLFHSWFASKRTYVYLQTCTPKPYMGSYLTRISVGISQCESVLTSLSVYYLQRRYAQYTLTCQ